MRQVDGHSQRIRVAASIGCFALGLVLCFTSAIQPHVNSIAETRGWFGLLTGMTAYVLWVCDETGPKRDLYFGTGFGATASLVGDEAISLCVGVAGLVLIGSSGLP